MLVSFLLLGENMLTEKQLKEEKLLFAFTFPEGRSPVQLETEGMVVSVQSWL